MCKSWKIGVALAVLVGLPTMALASIQVGDRIRFTDRPGTTGGGEFGVHLKLSANPAGGNAETGELFRTFCLERNERLDFNTNGFIVDTISKSAESGGFGGGNPDPLSQEVAWLYYNFTKETLAGYDFTPGNREASANVLQNAIWGFENEIAQNAAWLANPFVIAAQAASAADLAAAYSRVAVLNIKWATDRGTHDGVYESDGSIGPGENAQSVLYVIPEPATVLVWAGLSLLGLAAYRRRAKCA